MPLSNVAHFWLLLFSISPLPGLGLTCSGVAMPEIADFDSVGLSFHVAVEHATGNYHMYPVGPPFTVFACVTRGQHIGSLC